MLSAERSSSGLVQFESISDAIEALVICNHITLPNPCKFTFDLSNTSHFRNSSQYIILFICSSSF